VLTGAKGPALRAALAQRGHFGQIAKALQRPQGGLLAGRPGRPHAPISFEAG
jgi:hypothetical protein